MLLASPQLNLADHYVCTNSVGKYSTSPRPSATLSFKKKWKLNWVRKSFLPRKIPLCSVSQNTSTLKRFLAPPQTVTRLAHLHNPHTLSSPPETNEPASPRKSRKPHISPFALIRRHGVNHHLSSFKKTQTNKQTSNKKKKTPTQGSHFFVCNPASQQGSVEYAQLNHDADHHGDHGVPDDEAAGTTTDGGADQRECEHDQAPDCD